MSSSYAIDTQTSPFLHVVESTPIKMSHPSSETYHHTPPPQLPPSRIPVFAASNYNYSSSISSIYGRSPGQKEIDRHVKRLEDALQSLVLPSSSSSSLDNGYEADSGSFTNHLAANYPISLDQTNEEREEVRQKVSRRKIYLYLWTMCQCQPD